MRTMLIVSVLILSACNQTMKMSHPNIGTEPEFIPYVQMFEADYGSSIGDFPITFKSQSGDVIGLCIMWSDGYRVIEIDPTYWNSLTVSDADRKALMYHELGHCILNRDHDDGYISSLKYGLIARSIMNSYLMYELSYPDLQSYYINELFHPGSTSVSYPLAHNNCVKLIP